MGRAAITVNKKIEILDYFKRCKYIKATTNFFSNRSSKVQPSQICMCRKEQTLLRQKQDLNPKAFSVHVGRKNKNENLEKALYDWIVHQREQQLAVSSMSIIAKALCLQPNFENNSQKLLWFWVYPLLSRYNLSCLIGTHTGQNLNGHFLSVRKRFPDCLRAKFVSEGIYHKLSAAMFVNMDETVVFFKCKQKKSVHFKGENAVSTQSTGSNLRRMTVSVFVASDGIKLLIFFIYKGQPNKWIEKSLTQVLPPNIFGCCQPKVWMDQMVCVFGLKKCIFHTWVTLRNLCIFLTILFIINKKQFEISGKKQKLLLSWYLENMLSFFNLLTYAK